MIKNDYFRQNNLPNLRTSFWIDGLNHQGKLRSKYLVEISLHFEKILEE